MYYEDLSLCDYFGKEHATILTSIGWLEDGKDYLTGSIPSDVFLKLSEFSEISWSFASHCGVHYCDLCKFQFGVHREAGSSNIFVPGNGKIYVCPTLIVHYIDAHFYLPPREFVEAVYLCPPIRSMEYLRKIEENGGKEIAELMKKE